MENISVLHLIFIYNTIKMKSLRVSISNANQNTGKTFGQLRVGEQFFHVFIPETPGVNAEVKDVTIKSIRRGKALMSSETVTDYDDTPQKRTGNLRLHALNQGEGTYVVDSQAKWIAGRSWNGSGFWIHLVMDEFQNKTREELMQFLSDVREKVKKCKR